MWYDRFEKGGIATNLEQAIEKTNEAIKLTAGNSPIGDSSQLRTSEENLNALLRKREDVSGDTDETMLGLSAWKSLSTTRDMLAISPSDNIVVEKAVDSPETILTIPRTATLEQQALESTSLAVLKGTHQG